MEGAILAGGKSRRMGRPKPFVELGGRPLISWALEALRTECREVFIVADRVEPFQSLPDRVVRDYIPDRGPMGGVYTALLSAGGPFVFVSGCDTPFLSPALIRYLASQAGGYDIVVPRLPDGWHPLQAVYGKTCLSRMRDSLRDGRLSLIELIEASRVRAVSLEEVRSLDPGQLSFFNINTPRDLETAAGLLNRVV